MTFFNGINERENHRVRTGNNIYYVNYALNKVIMLFNGKGNTFLSRFSNVRMVHVLEYFQFIMCQAYNAFCTENAFNAEINPCQNTFLQNNSI